MSQPHTYQLIQQFYTACNALANAVNLQLFNGIRAPYWVANEVGGTCDFGDTDFLTPEEMVLILKANLTYDEYAERFYEKKNYKMNINYKITAFVAWVVITLIIVSATLRGVSKPCTATNLISITILLFWILLSIATNCLTFKNKKNNEKV
jgi:hypothetical protein